MVNDMNILRVENVSKSFVAHKALDNVSLEVPRGSVYGLLGPNGAGKTTLLRIINRITAPDTGRVLFDGHEMLPSDVFKIGYLPEERGLYRKMKVGEQAIFFARLRGLSRAEAVQRLKTWFRRFGIESWWNRKVEDLSKGMAQKVQFIVTVLHEPQLLIFDEPFSGFDPVNADLLKSEILSLRDKGATVIFSTHNMSSVEQICDHITLIDRSHNVLSGSVDEVRRRHGDNHVRIEYIGDGDPLGRVPLSLCTVIERGSLSPERHTMKIRIPDKRDIKTIIAAVNEAVELRSFEETIPAMNDIFLLYTRGGAGSEMLRTE